MRLLKCLKRLSHPRLFFKDRRGPSAPVIKVAADDERALAGNAGIDAIAKDLSLGLSSAFQQVQMKAEKMEGNGGSGKLDDPMQDSPTFQSITGNIDVLPV